MNYIKLTFTLIFLLALSGSSVKDYYFPISEWTESKIYKYECKLDPTKTEYWKLTSDKKNNILTTEAFNSDYEQYELFKEQLTSNGSELIEFISYQTSNNGQKDSIINKPIELDVFKWNTDKPYQYSSESMDPYYGKVTFKKKREFIKQEIITVLGKEYKALKFKGNYITQVERTNRFYEKNQFSYYAKGIGLVKMDKEYSNGSKVTLELTEIMTVDEWRMKK